MPAVCGGRNERSTPSIPASGSGRCDASGIVPVRERAELPDATGAPARRLWREASAWYGIGGPKRTPEEVIERLNKEVNVSIADPKLQARLADLGGTALGGSPADFAKLISDEVKKWSKVILAANLRRE